MPVLPLRTVLVVATVLAVAAAVHPRAASAQPPAALVVSRGPGDSVALDAAALGRLPRREVRARDHGRPAVFTGVAFQDALRAAGVRVDSLRGAALAAVVVVEAADGYRAAFALAELSPDLGGRTVLLADRHDGAPLDGAAGPWRLVVPEDGRAARWVRGVRRVTIVRAPADAGRAAAPR